LVRDDKECEMNTRIDPLNLPQKAACAIRCALADLIGAYQDHKMKGYPDSFHDWNAHLQSIDELAHEFDLQSEIPENLK
jgi:hypothetical protein